MKTLRRGAKAFFRDLYDNWQSCTVLNVSGSGSPSREIKVEIKTDANYNMGWSTKGSILEVEAIRVIPATAIQFLDWGGTIKSQYICQETYPEKAIKRKRQERKAVIAEKEKA